MAERRRKNREVTAEEQRLWRLVVKDTAPLSQQVRKRVRKDEAEISHPAPETQSPPPAVASESPPPVPPFSVGEGVRRPPVSVRRALPGLGVGESPGVDRRTAQRFKRGQMSIDARIDLHGMTQAAAHSSLIGFIESSAAGGRRCVLVITGKGARGEGVIRKQTPRWLNDERLRRHILSITTAQPHHGGEGAFYVLLRRKR